MAAATASRPRGTKCWTSSPSPIFKNQYYLPASTITVSATSWYQQNKTAAAAGAITAAATATALPRLPWL